MDSEQKLITLDASEQNKDFRIVESPEGITPIINIDGIEPELAMDGLKLSQIEESLQDMQALLSDIHNNPETQKHISNIELPAEQSDSISISNSREYDEKYKSQIELYLTSQVRAYKKTMSTLNEVFYDDHLNNDQRTTQEKMDEYSQLTMLDSPDFYVAAKKLSKLVPKSEQPIVAKSLIEHRAGFALLEELDSYDGVQNSDIIQWLLENNDSEQLLKHFEKLDLNINTLAQLFINKEQPETIVANADRFYDLDEALVEKLLTTNFNNNFIYELLYKEIENFKNINKRNVIPIIIEGGHITTFLDKAYLDEEVWDEIRTDTKTLQLLLAEIKSGNLGTTWLDELRYAFDTSDTKIAKLFTAAQEELS